MLSGWNSIVLPTSLSNPFGKETLLTLYTTIRGSAQQAAVDYIFNEAKHRNAGIFTTSHVFVEVAGTIKSRKGADGVAQFWADIEDSKTYVLHGARPWEHTTEGIGEKDIANGVMNLYNTWNSIDFKFHEGTLVSDASQLQNERMSETTYIISFDGKLTNLAWNEGLNVLPTETLHRTDNI